MDVEPFDDDDTSPGPCACGNCRRRALLEARVAELGVTRTTTMHAALSTGAQPWTVYLTTPALTVRGDGATEDDAIEDALTKL